MSKYESTRGFSQLNNSISTTNPEDRSHLYEPSRENILAHLFSGQVLANEDEHRYYLVSTIQKFRKNIIQKTKLLYRWDKLNEVNIHRYIDNNSNILLLIKTTKNTLLAAYSQSGFKEKVLSNQPGLLISLTNQQIFKNTKKAVIYDEHQVIFGNYDLRVKAGDSKVTSNFGSIGSFYENRGNNVTILFEEGKNREAKIKEMEIFSIWFQS